MNPHLPSPPPSARHRRRRRGGLALAALLSAGISCTPHGAYVRAEDLPAASAEPEYRIGPGDVLGVRVWNQDAMSTNRARVRDDGRISVPFLQDVEAAGVTAAELATKIQGKLKTYVVNPVVTVTLEEVRPLRVSVMGEVARPGQYEMDHGAGVLSALAAAGGFTDYAHRDDIFVLRSGPDRKEPLRIRFGYASLARAEAAQASFKLRPGDVVVVE